MANVRRFTFRGASGDEVASIEGRRGGVLLGMQAEVRETAGQLSASIKEFVV